MKKRLLSVALIATMLCSLLVAPVAAKEFPDATEHWAQSAISVWSDRGVVNGDDAGNFRPGDPITRAETAKLMDNLIGFQKTSNKVFSDVPTDAWYAQSINKLYAAEVITGYEDGTIRPTASISRQEAAVIIARAFALDTKKADQNLLSGFQDNDQIQDWARPTVAYMAGLAFVQGSDGMFRPGDPITRAEVVTILNNMVGIYADGSQSTYTGDYGDKIAIVKEPATFNNVTLGGAVVCGTVKGKVNFNSGSKVNGCVCNWSANASVSTAGATVSSTANKNGGSISAGGNFNSGYGSSVSSGGSSNGSTGSSSSSSTTQYNVIFYANGGQWSTGETQGTVTYSLGNSYALRMPTDPSRTNYIFDGWYTSQVAANTLNASYKLVTTEMVTATSCKFLYAGWRRPTGLHGTVAVATGANVANRGKSADELMDEVTLTETSAIDVYQATGGLRYVTEYTNSPTLSTEGNFLALTYTLPAGTEDPTAVILKTGFSDGSSEATYESFNVGNLSYTRVFEIGAADLGKDIVFTVDMNGNNTALNTITIDLSGLVRYQFVTVTTLEEFVAATNNPAAEKITVNAPITLTSGTYGSATTQKNLVLNHPISIEKDAAVTLQHMNIMADGSLSSLFINTTEVPAVAPITEGEGDGASSEPPTPVATKAASLTLQNISVTTTNTSSVLKELQVGALTAKHCGFSHDNSTPSTAITIGTLAEGDTVVLEHCSFDNYDVALEYKDITALNSGDNILKYTSFANNTTDIKLNASDIIPNIAYNYFADAPALAGTEGAITNYYGPLYTADSFVDSNLSENLHDAYVLVDGTLVGKLSETDTLALTFAGEETPCEIAIVPTDLRDTAVTINGVANTTASLLKADLPTELSIAVGTGTAKTIAVSESAPLE